MKKYYPCKTSLIILKVLGLLFTAGINVLAKLFLAPYRIIMWLVILLFWTSYIVILFIAMPIYFSRTNYFISKNEIAKQSGIIYFTRQIMRTESIQYVTTLSTPLSSFSGFNFIFFNALGGRVVLFFLSKKDMNEIDALISANIRQKHN